MTSLIEQLLSSEPEHVGPLTVDEALAIEGLEPGDVEFLLQVREMFSGKITVSIMEDEHETRETPETYEGLEIPEMERPQAGRRGGVPAHQGHSESEASLSLWSDSRIGNESDVSSGGIRDRRNPEFQVSDRERTAGTDTPSSEESQD